MTDYIACETAASFMRTLSLGNYEVWGNAQDKWRNRWIFRGQRNADWKLIPSAHREPLPAQIQSYVDNYKPRINGYIDMLLSMPEEITQTSPPGKYGVNGPARIYLNNRRSEILKFASISIAENALAWFYADKLDSVGLVNTS